MKDILTTFSTLLNEHGRLEAILESSFNGIIVMDLQGVIIACNPAAKQILHLKKEKCKACKLEHYLHLEEMDDVIKTLKNNNDEVLQFSRQLDIPPEENIKEKKFLEMKFLMIPGESEEHIVLILVDKSDVLRALNNREHFISTLIKIIDELKVDNRAIIYNLARLAELRDSGTGKHLERVEKFTRLIGNEYRRVYHEEDDRITDEYIEDMAISSVLHDIGKIGITDSILNKPSKLSDEEFLLIQEHTVIAGSALSSHIGKKDFLAMGREIALNHHEHWDGTGYPQKKKGEEIPFSARVVAICDVYDALTSERPYKEAFSHDKAVGIILQDRGKYFDPVLVDLFMNIHENFDEIRKEYHDE